MTTMTHERFQELLSDAIEGTLAPLTRQGFETHRRDCPECARIAAAFSRTLQALHRFPQLEVPAGFIEKILNRTSRRAPVAGLGEALVAWLRFPRLGPAGVMILLAIPLMLLAGTKEGRWMTRRVSIATHRTYSDAVRLYHKSDDLKERVAAARGTLPARLGETVGWIRNRFGGQPADQKKERPELERRDLRSGFNEDAATRA